MNHTFGVCAVLPHLALYLLVAETSGETQMLPGMVSMWGGLGWSQCVRCFRVAAVDQLSVAHTVVCSLSFSSLMTPKMQSMKGIAGIITLLFFPCAYSACCGFISLIVGFSLILYFMYGLSKMRLPQHRVLAYLLPAPCECFGMYSPAKE